MNFGPRWWGLNLGWWWLKMTVFQWQRGVRAWSKKLGRVEVLQYGSGMKVYDLLLHRKKLVTFYLYFHSNIAYFCTSAYQ